MSVTGLQNTTSRTVTRRVSLVLLLTSLSIYSTAARSPGARDAASADRLAESVDRHYNSLRTFKADFQDGYRGAGVERAESGTLLLKKPGKMRWDYQQPRSKVFLSDGKTAFFYVAGERQARRTPVKKLDDLRSPLRYLLGRTKLKQELEKLELAPGTNSEKTAPGNLVLRGAPKGVADRVKQVELEINPQSQIVRITLQEVDGATTTFRFSNIVENLTLPDDRFRFTPPPGVEMVESTEFAP